MRRQEWGLERWMARQERASAGVCCSRSPTQRLNSSADEAGVDGIAITIALQKVEYRCDELERRKGNNTKRSCWSLVWLRLWIDRLIAGRTHAMQYLFLEVEEEVFSPQENRQLDKSKRDHH